MESRQRQGAARDRLRFAPGELDVASSREPATLWFARAPASPTRQSACRETRSTPDGDGASAAVARARPPRLRPERDARRMIRELTSDCVHCGFCLPTCPTYVLWREEMDSPRGRIHLMDARLDGTIALTADRHEALRPLPRLHGLPQLVPLRRPLRQADRVDPRRRRERVRASVGRAAPARAALQSPPAPRPHARRAPARTARTSPTDCRSASARSRRWPRAGVVTATSPALTAAAGRREPVSVCSPAASSGRSFPM